ncbi:MAG: acyl carrier protein [Nitrospirae bacterium]|nr:acyl carrier protein [Nitrospirota bacterium]
MSSPGVVVQTQGSLTREAVLERLGGLLKDLLKLENTALLTPQARLNEDLNIDSLGMVDLVIFVEEAFSVKFRSA